MKDRDSDASFEQYRRERQRRRTWSGGQFLPQGENLDTLHELEKAEAKEVRDRQLTREVHEFFSEATKTAASIVQKVSDEHQEEATEKLSWEMEEFLMDAFQRMNSFVSLIKRRSNPDGPVEQILEADMHRLVGPALDAFRSQGTAGLDDKHLGQDPFDTEVELDSGEERAAAWADEDDDGTEDDGDIQVRPTTGPNLSGPVEDIEQHLVAELHRGDEEEAGPAATDASGDEDEDDDEIEPEERDFEKLKVALRTLVRQGLLTKDEARAKYREAIESGSTSPL